MPDLNGMRCTIEIGTQNYPLQELGITYSNQKVECYVAVPIEDIQFSIHFTAPSCVGPGLAVFVFIDGQYQVNRNRTGTSLKANTRQVSGYDIDFRFRQKEETGIDGKFIVGRDWHFSTLQSVCPDNIPHIDRNLRENLGTIEVVVLRCTSNNSLHPPSGTDMGLLDGASDRHSQQNDRRNSTTGHATASIHSHHSSQKQPSTRSAQRNVTSLGEVHNYGKWAANNAAKERPGLSTPSIMSVGGSREHGKWGVISAPGGETKPPARSSGRSTISDHDINAEIQRHLAAAREQDTVNVNMPTQVNQDHKTPAYQTHPISTNAKSYWNTWNAGSKGYGETERYLPNFKTRQPKDPYVSPEYDQPRICADFAARLGMSLQATTGKGARYDHPRARPIYLDSMGAPFGVFTFHYRGRDFFEKQQHSHSPTDGSMTDHKSSTRHHHRSTTKVQRGRERERLKNKSEQQESKPKTQKPTANPQSVKSKDETKSQQSWGHSSKSKKADSAWASVQKTVDNWDDGNRGSVKAASHASAKCNQSKAKSEAGWNAGIDEPDATW